ncbi:MAG: amidohydrolase family protein [Pelolinea sp.]|nr:amidohydrolase family protein [Pelolinea sp.]
MNDANCDLLIRNVRINDSENVVDISIKDGEILKITPSLDIQSVKVIDGTGCIISPPFIDPHTHIDKAFLIPSINRSGTLEEAIEIMKLNKNDSMGSNFDNRADKAIFWALKQGTLFLRTHVDVSSKTGTKSIEAMQRVKDRWKGIVEIQIVAFPQDGLIRFPEVKKYIRQAVEIGADVVGGIPAIEENSASAQNHIDYIFQIADEFDIDVDMHIDESDDPNSRTLEMLAETTIRAGWEKRVSAAHCCALASYSNEYAWKVIDKVARAKISIITNPMVNLVLQGRNDQQPIRRGITRVKELISAGVNVSCGGDNLQDVFYPFGKCDMLEVAFITSITAQMTGFDEIKYVLDMPRNNAAQILGLQSYGITEGKEANMVVIPANSYIDLIANKPPRRLVIRKGKIVCETKESVKTPQFVTSIGNF